MVFGSNKTKLDYIIENGMNRIDSAVEKVCDKYGLIPIDTRDPLEDLQARGMIRGNLGIELMAFRQAQATANENALFCANNSLMNRAGMAGQAAAINLRGINP
jgi:hypothetical protein